MTDPRHSDLQMICQRLGELFGLNFPESQWDSMLRNLMNVAVELKRDPASGNLAQWFAEHEFSKQEMDVLIKHFTIGETYFFREDVALEFFRKAIIPQLIATGAGISRQMRIWSAGCSSGEEPYTLAMLLTEMIPDIKHHKINIFATDLNPEALTKAEKGVYPPWSFRETPQDLKQKYFTQNGKFFSVNKDIQQMVTFVQLNLATADFPSSHNSTHQMDVIFCRNVLMYFLPEIAKAVTHKFYQTLNDGGWLITSQVELNDDYYSHFHREMHGNGIFYHKISQAAPQLFEGKMMDTGKFSPKANKQKSLSQQKVAPLSKTSPILTGNKDKSQNKVQSNHFNNATGNKLLILKQLFDESRYAECSKNCIDYLSSNPFDNEAATLLIRSLANLGKLTEAVKFADRLIESDGINADSLYLYATILMEQAEWEKAEKMLMKALYINPDFPAAQLSMGNVLAKLGKKQMAAKHFSHLSKLLQTMDDEDVVAGMEGMTAGRLRQMTQIMAG